jgi:DNA-binding GntR family transcriptional regulator
MPLPDAVDTAGSTRRTFLREHAFDTIYRAIYDGTLEPGEQLREDQLMSWLGMSKSPIRAALIRLQQYGLVDMSAGRATTVAAIDPERTNRAMLLSGWLNTWALERVSGHLDADALRALSDAAADLDSAYADAAPARMAEAVEVFFSVITSAGGNTVLAEQVEQISTELARFLQPEESGVDPAAMVRDVNAVEAALQRGDAAAARAALDDLYAPAHENFLASYRDPEIA